MAKYTITRGFKHNKETITTVTRKRIDAAIHQMRLAVYEMHHDNATLDRQCAHDDMAAVENLGANVITMGCATQTQFVKFVNHAFD